MIYFSGKIPIVLDFLARDIANHLYALDTPFDRRIKPFEYWNPTYHYCHLITYTLLITSLVFELERTNNDSRQIKVAQPHQRGC